MKVFFKESLIPVFVLLACLSLALILLRNSAETQSRKPEQIHISAGDVRMEIQTGSDMTSNVTAIEAQGETLDAEQLLALEEGMNVKESGWVGYAMRMAVNDSLPAAIAVLSMILAKNPHHGSAWFAAGSVFSRQGNRQKAIEAYENAARYSGGRAKAVPLYNLGCLYRDTGREEEAIKTFRRAVEERPDYIEAHLNQAILVSKNPDTRLEAYDLYERLLRLSPSYAQAYFNRGIMRMVDGEIGDAIEDFRRTVEIDPGFSKSWYNLGRLASRRGRGEDAVICYRKAIETNPDNAKASLNLAIVLAGLDRYEEAAETGQQTVARYPQYASAMYNLAIALTKLERLNEARKAYDKVLEMEPANARAWQNLGVLYAREEKSSKAMNCYREALALDPANPSARYNLALEHRRIGNLELALEEASRLRRLDPNHSKARRFLRTTAKRLLESDPENSLALDILTDLEGEGS